MADDFEDDRIAIRRIKSGDPGGLDRLVDRYQEKAVRTAFLILRDEQHALDIVQDAFLRVYHRISQFDESRPFSPYFLRSVVNACLDSVRAENKSNICDQDVETLADCIQSAANLEDQMERSQARQEIFEALGTLTYRQRAAVVMRYYLEMNETEVAIQLDARPGTVKWLLSVARQRLRLILTNPWRES